MEEYLQIGVITKTHGVRVEVKVYPTTDPERFLSLDRVFLDTGKEKKELHVTGVRFFKQLAIVKFKGIDDINDIERYKGCSLYVTREDAIPLEEDEYYIADLQGMQMYTEDGELFGTLRDVMETGANDVYIVDSKEHGEVLIPAIHDCILDVDLDEQKNDEISYSDAVSGDDRAGAAHQHPRKSHQQRLYFPRDDEYPGFFSK